MTIAFTRPRAAAHLPMIALFAGAASVSLISVVLPARAMDFGQYSAACKANGGTASIGNNGVYTCGFGGGGGGGGSSLQQQMMQNMMQMGTQAIINGFIQQGQEADAEAARAQAAEQAAERAREAQAAQNANAARDRLLQGMLSFDDTGSTQPSPAQPVPANLPGSTPAFGLGGNGSLQLMPLDQPAPIGQVAGTAMPTAPPTPPASSPDQPAVVANPQASGDGTPVVDDTQKVPLLRKPEKSTIVNSSKPPAPLPVLVRLLELPRLVSDAQTSPACKALNRELTETKQLARRAVLAADIYSIDDGPGDRALLTDSQFQRIGLGSREIHRLFPGADDAYIESLLEPANSDFRAALYLDRSTNKIVLVFRGTQALSASDWRSGNADQAFGLGSPYYKNALQIASILKQSTAQRGGFEIVGHSLGGGMADAAGLAYQVKTTAFNPSGVSSATLPPGTNMTAAPRYDTDYVVDGEILNQLQDHPLQTRAALTAGLTLGGPLTAAAAVGDLADRATMNVVNGGDGETATGIKEVTAALTATLPAAIGQRVTLAPDPADAQAGDPVRLHLMQSVIDAISARFATLVQDYHDDNCGL